MLRSTSLSSHLFRAFSFAHCVKSSCIQDPRFQFYPSATMCNSNSILYFLCTEDSPIINVDPTMRSFFATMIQPLTNECKTNNGSVSQIIKCVGPEDLQWDYWNLNDCSGTTISSIIFPLNKYIMITKINHHCTISIMNTYV